MKANQIAVSGGGPVGNALVVASKLGMNASVVGGFANDEAGKYLLNDFNKYSVNTDNVVVKEASSFVSYILLSEKEGTRTCVFDRGTVVDDVENVNLSAIDGADVLHLDGNYLNCAIYAAKYARDHGVAVSLDAGGLYSGIETLLPYVDILIPSSEFILGLTKKSDIKEAMREVYNKYNPKVFAVTDGKNGGYYYENGEIIHYDAFCVETLDSNGAGDTFHGAFLVAYLDGKSVMECCEYASLVAGYKVSHKGARTYPLSKEIIDGLKK
jgi:sugar/nucleoside kinase (ribokinase family)